MTLVMGLLFSVILVQSLAGASTEVTMQAPYDRSGFRGTAVADHKTGTLSAEAASAVPSSSSSSSGWIAVDHELAADVSSIDYEIALEGTVRLSHNGYSWVRASASRSGCCTAQDSHDAFLVSLGPSTLRFTLSNPDGLVEAGTVGVRVELGAWAGFCQGLNPCTGFPNIWGPGSAISHIRVTSIRATVHLDGAEPPTSIALDAHGYKIKGLQKTDLSWTTASSSMIDVYRDGVTITTTENDGLFTDHIDRRGKGTYTYKVCEAGTSTCSNEATVEF